MRPCGRVETAGGRNVVDAVPLVTKGNGMRAAATGHFGRRPPGMVAALAPSLVLVSDNSV
jgi:hypothetical protein